MTFEFIEADRVPAAFVYGLTQLQVNDDGLAAGHQVEVNEWHSAALKRSLTSETLLGYAVAREPIRDAQGRIQRNAKGKKLFGPEEAVRNDDGSPVVRAQPIITRKVFDRLAVELADRENRKEPTKRSSGLLLRVIWST